MLNSTIGCLTFLMAFLPIRFQRPQRNACLNPALQSLYPTRASFLMFRCHFLRRMIYLIVILRKDSGAALLSSSRVSSYDRSSLEKRFRNCTSFFFSVRVSLNIAKSYSYICLYFHTHLRKYNGTLPHHSQSYALKSVGGRSLLFLDIMFRQRHF